MMQTKPKSTTVSSAYFAGVCLATSLTATLAGAALGLSPFLYLFWLPLTLVIGGIMLAASAFRRRRRAAARRAGFQRHIGAAIPGAVPVGGAFDYDRFQTSLFDDDSLLNRHDHLSTFSAFDDGPYYPSIGGIDDFHSRESDLNPATGLPMCGGIDTAGNPYGCSGTTSFDPIDHGSINGFEDGLYSTAGSSFDDW